MADRGLKPTATFGGRSATKDKNPADSWRELRGATIRESSTGPCSSVSVCRSQGHTVCGLAVLVAVMAPSTIHVSASFARPRRSSVTVAPAPATFHKCESWGLQRVCDGSGEGCIFAGRLLGSFEQIGCLGIHAGKTCKSNNAANLV